MWKWRSSTLSNSHLEAAFALIIRAAGLPEPVREYRFAPGRKYPFDFAWPDHLVAVEIEGGIWNNGQHVRGVGYQNNCIKYNLATLMGWRLLRYTSGMLNDPDMVAAQVAQLLAIGPIAW